MALPRFAKRRAQRLDMIRQQRQPPLRQIDGEEEAPTLNEVGAIAVLRRSRHQTSAMVSLGLNLSYGLSSPTAIIGGNSSSGLFAPLRRRKYSVAA